MGASICEGEGEGEYLLEMLAENGIEVMKRRMRLPWKGFKGRKMVFQKEWQL